MKNLEQHIALVEETANYFNLSNRGVNDGEVATGNNCTYFNDDTGNKCAVGRCLIPEVAELLGSTPSSPNRMDKVLKGNNYEDRIYVRKVLDKLKNRGYSSFDSLLQEEYRSFKLELWDLLQNLHDVDGYWTEEGLSASGERKKKDILDYLKAHIQ